MADQSAFWGGDAVGTSVWDSEPADPGQSPASAETARYRRVSLIAAGGMGSVWLGWDTVLERQVALKIPRPDLPSAAEMLRHEAAVAARLDHPGIVVIHDSVVQDGQPMFVMAYVPGRPLADVLGDNATAEERTRLLLPFAEVCRAVGHAHASGVVHRDLSPRNLLVGDGGTLHVIDWGLAWSTRDGNTPPLAAGTAGFAPPEQRARQETAEPTADVWALGRILSAILFGLDEKGLPGTDGACSPDLRAIVHRATAAAPADRYPDAAALERDLRAWIEGRRVEAYAMPPWQAAWRELWRLRRPLGAGVAIMGVVMAALVWGQARARAEAERAAAAEIRALKAASDATDATRDARTALAASLAVQAREAWRRYDLHGARSSAEASLRVEPEQPLARGVAMLLDALPQPEVVEEHPLPPCARWALTSRADRMVCMDTDQTRIVSGPPGFAPLETIEIGSQQGRRGGVYHWLMDGLGFVIRVDLEALAVEFAPVRNLPFSDPVEPLRFDAASGEPLLAPWDVAPCATVVHATVRTAAGTTFACADRGAWHVHPDGRAERLPALQGAVLRALAADNTGRVWGATTDGYVVPVDGLGTGIRFAEPVNSLQGHPTLPWLLARFWSGVVAVIDPHTLEVIATLPPADDELYVDPETGLVAAIHEGRLVRWRLPGAGPGVPHREQDGFSSVAFSHDASAVAASGAHGQVVLIERGDGQSGAMRRVEAFHWASQVVKDARFSADGRTIFASAAHADGLLRIDRVARAHAVQPAARNRAMPAIAVLDDGAVIAAQYSNPPLRLRDNRLDARGFEDGVYRSVHAPVGGTRAVLCGAEIRLMGSHGPPRLVRPASAAESWSLCAMNASGRIAAVEASGLRVLLTHADGGLPDRWLEVESAVWSIALSAEDEGRLAIGQRDGSIRLVDVTDLRTVAEIPAHRERVSGVDISADGHWLVSTGWDGMIRFSRLRRGGDEPSRMHASRRAAGVPGPEQKAMVPAGGAGAAGR